MSTLALQWGCYAYLPIQTSPPAANSRAAVTLSDRGRLMLADRLGTDVVRVDGIVVAHDSTGVTMLVNSVRDVRGGSSLWTGERVQIPAEAILGYQQRELSKRKSFLLAGAIAAVLLVTLGVSLDLFADDLNRGDTANPPGDNGGLSFRGPALQPSH
jgi:hypothetical protein